MTISAVYDACVLYSGPLRDLLLNIATTGLAKPFWSNEILEEWIRSRLRNRPELNRDNLERIRRLMNNEYPYALVRGYEYLIPKLSLPDENDRHVLAAAIHVGASFIVTFNLDDFPKKILGQYHIEAISPDDFVCRLIQINPLDVLIAAANHRVNLTRPPKTVDEYLATLEKQQLTRTLAFLREHRDEI